MSVPVANLKLKLDGEAEYRAALSSIDKSFKELGSEMNLLSAKFAENGDSVEALSAKNDVLNRKVETQQQRVDTLKKAVEEAKQIQEQANKAFEGAAAALDAGSDEYKTLASQVQKAADQTAVWQTKLNNAEAALYGMKDALDENNEAIEKAQRKGTGLKGVFANLKESFADGKSEAVGLGDAIGGAADKLGIQLPEGASKALNSLNGISAGAAAVVGGFAAVAAVIVKTEKALIDMTKEAAAGAKE